MNENNQPPKLEKKTFFFLFTVITSLILVYGIPLYVLGKNSLDYIPDNSGILPFVLSASLIMIFVSFKFHIKAKVARTGGEYFVWNIVSWALNDAISVMGFVLSFNTGSILYYLGAAIVAILLNLFMRPEGTKIDQILAREKLELEIK